MSIHVKVDRLPARFQIVDELAADAEVSMSGQDSDVKKVNDVTLIDPQHADRIFPLQNNGANGVRKRGLILQALRAKLHVYQGIGQQSQSRARVKKQAP